MKKRKVVKNNFEYVFAGLIVCIALISYFMSEPNAQYKNELQNIPLELSINQDSDEFSLFYNQFWQQFNSSAIIYADTNRDSIISQTEVELYKHQFLKFYGFYLDDNTVFVIDSDKIIVDPNKLQCYLNNFNKTNPPDPNPKC